MPTETPLLIMKETRLDFENKSENRLNFNQEIQDIMMMITDNDKGEAKTSPLFSNNHKSIA